MAAAMVSPHVDAIMRIYREGFTVEKGHELLHLLGLVPPDDPMLGSTKTVVCAYLKVLHVPEFEQNIAELESETLLEVQCFTAGAEMAKDRITQLVGAEAMAEILGDGNLSVEEKQDRLVDLIRAVPGGLHSLADVFAEALRPVVPAARVAYRLPIDDIIGHPPQPPPPAV